MTTQPRPLTLFLEKLGPTLTKGLHLLGRAIYSKFLFCVLKHSKMDFYIKRADLSFFPGTLRLSSDLRFNTLVDISVVDFQESRGRFKIIYSLLSPYYWERLSVNYFLSELDLAASVKSLFSAADWLEREVWDMFGVFFINHNDLRRILTDYGFRGYPLKKDFPLTGYLELRFDDSRGDVVYEPVELAQELRFFNFSSGWERE